MYNKKRAKDGVYSFYVELPHNYCEIIQFIMKEFALTDIYANSLVNALTCPSLEDAHFSFRSRVKYDGAYMFWIPVSMQVRHDSYYIHIWWRSNKMCSHKIIDSDNDPIINSIY